MFKTITLFTFVVLLFSGCASVSMEGTKKSAMIKKFSPASDGKAGLYIYRSGYFGAALKKDIWVDGKCIGESAPNVFFYEEVSGGVEHKVSTESEFSPNALIFKTDSGHNYFIRQYIKLGVVVGGANLELVDEEEGKSKVAKLGLAKKGNCSK